MDIRDQLEKWKAEARPIGFSPWRDASGILWGVVTKVNAGGFTVEEITPLGQPDGEECYRFSEISYFDASSIYSERLHRLRKFWPTKPDDLTLTADRKTVRGILEEAHQTGEICHVRLRGEEGLRTIKLAGLNKDWVDLLDFDDLMREDGRTIWRVSAVEAVRWRTASEEADEFLLKLV